MSGGVPIFVKHWGGIICNITPILPYFQLWGMNLDHDFVQVIKLSEDPKKKVFTKNGTNFFPKIRWRPKKKIFTKNETFFFPKSSGHLRSDAHQSQIIGGCRCRLYSHYWKGYSQISGENTYIPHSPRVSVPQYVSILAKFESTRK